jgi:hypothetical protein
LAALFEAWRRRRRQLGDAGGGDLGLGRVKVLEGLERFERREAGVGDVPIAIHVQTGQPAHAAQVRQPGVGDPGPVEREIFEVDQRFETSQSGVGDRVASDDK